MYIYSNILIWYNSICTFIWYKNISFSFGGTRGNCLRLFFTLTWLAGMSDDGFQPKSLYSICKLARYWGDKVRQRNPASASLSWYKECNGIMVMKYRVITSLTGWDVRSAFVFSHYSPTRQEGEWIIHMTDRIPFYFRSSVRDIQRERRKIYLFCWSNMKYVWRCQEAFVNILEKIIFLSKVEI